ncbi:MAG: SAM-dependent methyltransferase [Stackebrandtia sp.]
MTTGHATTLSLVYSPTTWDVYEHLDRSLDPRGPDWLHERAGELLEPGAVVLDAGCRDSAHLIRLVRANGVSGIGVDPVGLHAKRAAAAVAAAGLDDRIAIVHGGVEDLDVDDDGIDVIWCRDVLEQVEHLTPFLSTAARLLSPGGHMLVYTTVATSLLEPGEALMLHRHLGNVPGNLDEANVESAFDGAGFVITDKDVIGTEWREYAEERTRPAATALLRLARLRRRRESIVAEHGVDIYHHVEANLHWEVFQLLGKLRSIVYLLRPRR